MANVLANIARIPITNFYADGDYTGVIRVGPNQKPMNVLLDTGSSALALDAKKYQPELTAGKFVQSICAPHPEITACVLRDRLPQVRRQSGRYPDAFQILAAQMPDVSIFPKPHFLPANEEGSDGTARNEIEAIPS